PLADGTADAFSSLPEVPMEPRRSLSVGARLLALAAAAALVQLVWLLVSKPFDLPMPALLLYGGAWAATCAWGAWSARRGDKAGRERAVFCSVALLVAEIVVACAQPSWLQAASLVLAAAATVSLLLPRSREVSPTAPLAWWMAPLGAALALALELLLGGAN